MFPYDKSDVKSEVEGNGCSGGRMVVVHRRLQMAGRRCRTVVGGRGRKEGRREVLDVCARLLSRQIQFDKQLRVRNPVVSVVRGNKSSDECVWSRAAKLGRTYEQDYRH